MTCFFNGSLFPQYIQINTTHDKDPPKGFKPVCCYREDDAVNLDLQELATVVEIQEDRGLDWVLEVLDQVAMDQVELVPDQVAMGLVLVLVLGELVLEFLVVVMDPMEQVKNPEVYRWSTVKDTGRVPKYYLNSALLFPIIGCVLGVTLTHAVQPDLMASVIPLLFLHLSIGASGKPSKTDVCESCLYVQ